MIQPALTALADLLTAGGIPANLDPAQVNPPGAWVSADQVERNTLDGGWIVKAHIDLVVPSYTVGTALATLDDLLKTTLEVIEPDGPIKVDQGIELANGSILPAYRIPIDLETD